MNKVVAVLLLAAVINSCKKDEGTGGNSTIKGTAMLREYFSPDFTLLLDERPAFGEKVYIIYGDETGVGDNTDINIDGQFEFKYLRKGSYKLFVISDDSANCTPLYVPDTVFTKVVEITDKKETVDAGNFLIYKINN